MKVNIVNEAMGLKEASLAVHPTIAVPVAQLDKNIALTGFWLAVDKANVFIAHRDGGLEVTIYRKGQEDDHEVTGMWIPDEELEND